MRAPSIFAVIVALIGLRFRRQIGKAVSPLAAGACRIIGRFRQGESYPGRHVEAENGYETLASSRPAQGLRMPQISCDGVFPKVIFQTWKSKASLPDNYAIWSESLRRLNPDFEYILWDDSDNRQFIEEYYPWFLPIYDAYPREIYRADAVRYFFLYQFGGLYVDMDTECLKPLIPLFRSGDVWLGRMGSDPDFPHSIPNAIMASRPRQEFWMLVIHFLIENAAHRRGTDAISDRHPEAMTGPILLKKAFDIYASWKRGDVEALIQGIAARLPDTLQPRAEASEIVLLSNDIWYPIDWSNIIHFHLLSEITDSQLILGDAVKRLLFPNSFLATYWTHSWKAPIR